MKKSKYLTQKIGFKPNSSTTVQKAFVNHLIRAINRSAVAQPIGGEELRKIKKVSVQPEQLCFDFYDTVYLNQKKCV